MTRLHHILLTVMVVMVAAFFAGHEALAKVLTCTGGEDASEPTETTVSTGAAGTTRSKAVAGTTASRVAAATTRLTLARATTLSTPATPMVWIT